MGTCTALHIHDNSPCAETATNVNGKFCQFHARQVQGLYEGYKRRSLELEALEKETPRCLPKNFGNTDFSVVKALPQLKEIYAYMLKRYNLVTRCIMARDFHHSHFYADTSDFGHQAYLERLRSTRALLTTTLGRIEKRTLDVQYSNTQWYNWVESFQVEMDAKSEAEKKKVKAEAALFKAHKENVSKLRDEEEAKRRLQAEKEEVWDPIEEIIEDARAGYVALVRVLINAEGVEEKEMEIALKRAKEINAAATGELGARMAASKADRLLAKRRRHMEASLMRGPGGTQQPPHGLRVQSHEQCVREELERRNRKILSEMDKVKPEGGSEEEEPKKKEQPKKKKGKRGKKNRTSEKDPAPTVESDHGEVIEAVEGVQEASDSEDDFLDLDPIQDKAMKEIIQSITDLVIANQPALEINVDSEGGPGNVRAEVRAIHEYLLLRAIIASPSLLSAAILSSSIDEFLHDTVHVRNTDLRDLALELSKPSDDSIRDACADYWVGAKMGDLESTGDDELSNELVVHRPEPKNVDKEKKKEKKRQSKPTAQTSEKGGKMDRVKICGKWIYNYPAETKMPRRGWFQFAILTGTSFFTAANLCKSWQEFYELNILSLNGYFRGLKNGWDTTRESPPLAHLRRIGFIPYALSHNSVHASGFTQTSRQSGSSVRLHAATEARNYIAANMSRDDPRVYRFIEILKTHCSDLLVYIKDCKTGEVLVDPPVDERWMIRDKIGAGRLHRGKWTIRQHFDKGFKATLERERLWKSFRDCLDVVIWDRLPARPTEHLQYTLMKLLHKAFKFTDHISVLESTLEVYYRTAKEEEGKEGSMAARVRDIKMAIREYRRKSDADGGKKDKIKRRQYLFYDSVDEDVDKDHPYDSHATRKIQKSLKGDVELRELAQQHKSATDAREVERLEKILIEKMMSKIQEEMPKEREPTIDDDLEDQEEDWEDASDSYWDDDEDRHMEFIGIWDQAKEENEELYDQAEEFSSAMFDQQLKRFPGKEHRYQEQRKFLNDVGRRQNNMNSRTRQKLEKREQEIMTGTPFIPQNFMRCQYIIERLWGESPEVSKKDLREYRKEFEALHDKERRAKFPPPRRPPKAPQYALDEWDKLRPKRGESMNDYDIPRDWEHAIQKQITRLWKRGLIQPSWSMSCVPIFVGREGAHKSLYLYSDYRGLVISGMLLCPTTGNPEMQIPPGPGYLREEMEKHEKESPGSTYSLLRVASEPDCWPSEMCEEDSLHTAIFDREGRIWEWIQTPKDLPWSDYVMHDNVRFLLRDPPSLNPTSEHSVTSYVRHRVDTILIMGDEDKCKQWSTLCLGYVRKQPYCYEIDLARSFLRVDAKFLRGLQECWWE